MERQIEVIAALKEAAPNPVPERAPTRNWVGG